MKYNIVKENSITLTESERVKNIREVQRLNDINYTDGQPLDEFTIEMETGTGKTYVYLKSIYQLNKQYGFKKFVIVVPMYPKPLKTQRLTPD